MSDDHERRIAKLEESLGLRSAGRVTDLEAENAALKAEIAALRQIYNNEISTLEADATLQQSMERLSLVVPTPELPGMGTPERGMPAVPCLGGGDVPDYKEQSYGSSQVRPHH